MAYFVGQKGPKGSSKPVANRYSTSSAGYTSAAVLPLPSARCKQAFGLEYTFLGDLIIPRVCGKKVRTKESP